MIAKISILQELSRYYDLIEGAPSRGLAIAMKVRSATSCVPVFVPEVAPKWIEQQIATIANEVDVTTRIHALQRLVEGLVIEVTHHDNGSLLLLHRRGQLLPASLPPQGPVSQAAPPVRHVDRHFDPRRPM
nr:hypothetical protein [Paraliomyxa miuraensis]